MRMCLTFAQVRKLDIGSGLVVNQSLANSLANCQLGFGDPSCETMNWPLPKVNFFGPNKFCLHGCNSQYLVYKRELKVQVPVPLFSKTP